MSTGILGARSYLAVAEESTYGTAVTPGTHFPRIISSTLGETRQIDPVPHMSAFGGNHLVGRDSAHLATDVGGEIIVPLFYDAYETHLLLKHALGAVATTGAGPYTHTYTLDSDGVTGLTIQQVHGDHPTLPEVEVFDGCVISSFEISTSARSYPTLKLGVIGRSGSDLTTVSGSASFGSEEQILAHHAGKISWNSLSHQSLDWTIRCDKKLARRPSVSSLYTDQPLPSDATEITLRGRFEWINADLYAAFRAGTTGDLTIDLVGTGNNAGTIPLHNCMVISCSKPITRKGILIFDVELRAHSDASNAGISIAITNDNAGAIS